MKHSLILDTPQTPSTPLLRVSRTIELLKSYRFSQILNRVWNLAKSKWNRGIRSVPDVPEFEINSDTLPLLKSLYSGRQKQWKRQWNQEKQTSLENDDVSLLNETRTLGTNWEGEQIQQASHLWRFHLHYHEFFLRGFAFGHEGNAASSGKHHLVETILSNWLTHHDLDQRPARGDAWHPYVISRRLPVWCQLLSLNCLSTELNQKIQPEIIRQARCLEVNLEWDLCGNHLLENLRGLGYATSLFSGSWSENLQQKIHLWLEEQIAHQILPTGEHYERSPMYHCQVTGILLELSQLFKNSNSSLHQLCLETADKMMGFLDRIVHPDGEIPLFNDAVFEEAPDVETLHCWRRTIDSSSSSTPLIQDQSSQDYWVQGDQTNRIIVDCGPVAAHDLPAHGHCDLGNFEWSYNSKRWLTDSGVKNYAGGAEHFFCRNSIAHSVMTIDRQSNCDVWGKFRMGRRGEIKGHRTGQSQCRTYQWIQFWHDGYKRQQVSSLHRVFIYHRTGTIWIVDFAESKANSISDRIGYLHFTPDVSIESLSGSEFSLKQNETQVNCSFTNSSETHLKQGIYCHEFGKAEERSSIEYIQSGTNMPVVCQLSPVNLESKNNEVPAGLNVATQDKAYIVEIGDLSWHYPAPVSGT